MKNEQLQAMGLTPWLGDTRSVNKGGKAAKRTLTDLCRECRELRDLCIGSQAACMSLRDDVCNVLERCIQEREAMERLYGLVSKKMRQVALLGLCWFGAVLVTGVCFWVFS